MNCLLSIRSCRRTARWRGLDNENGAAIVEFALVLSLVCVPLIYGIVSAAQAVYASIEVSNAAHAGADYGMQSLTAAADNTDITTAAQNEAADFGSNLTVTPTTFWACSTAIGGTQYATQSAATTACTGGSNHALFFVQVVASVTVKSPVACCGLPPTYSLSSTSVMEVEE